MDLSNLKPDQVCAWIQKRIRARLGDAVENASSVYARNGFYFIELKRPSTGAKESSGPLRRWKVGQWLRQYVV